MTAKNKPLAEITQRAIEVLSRELGTADAPPIYQPIYDRPRRLRDGTRRIVRWGDARANHRRHKGDAANGGDPKPPARNSLTKHCDPATVDDIESCLRKTPTDRELPTPLGFSRARLRSDRRRSSR